MFKRCKYLLLFLFSCIKGIAGEGQSYNYVQYTEKDGLASSTVYSMLQDKLGFMWFGTETGLSRFDGTNFRTFTTKDGLPDNEILKMYEDSKGRIWLLPFRNAICYYYKGKIHNQQNDSVLKKIVIKDRPLNLFEDKEGIIWFNESNSVFKIYPDKKVEVLAALGGIPLTSIYLFSIDSKQRVWFSVTSNDSNTIYFIKEKGPVKYTSNNIRTYQNEFEFSKDIRLWVGAEMKYFIESENNKGIDTFSINNLLGLLSINNISSVDDTLIFFNGQRGAMSYNLRTKKLSEIYLPGKSVNEVIRDFEGSIWISTIGQGVFRVKSDKFYSINIKPEQAADKGIYSLGIFDNKFSLGGAGYFLEYSLKDLKLIFNSEPVFHSSDKKNKVLYIEKTPGGYVLFNDYSILWLDKELNIIKRDLKIYTKDIFKTEDTTYAAITSGLVRINNNLFKVIDTIWRGRTSAVFVKNDTVYIGTLLGLYNRYPDGTFIFLGNEFPELKSRISAITATKDGSIWVASYDNGIVQLKNDSVCRHFTDSDGLTSNICRTIYADGNELWVGTDKGLNRIQADDDYKITKFSSSDGLSSDMINRVLTYGDTVIVATSDGVSYFNKTHLAQYSETRLNILEVYNDNMLLPEGERYRLGGANLKVSYVGISYKSAGDIIYKYRLKGVDDEWKTTRETTLEFVSLPYGDYELELIAENKFGVVSEKKTIGLHVPTPFWKTGWFYSLLIVVAGTLTYLLYKRRLKVIRSGEEEKTAFNKKMAEMEMKALRAQMNPHFTFNVLNSIQYFIGYNDTLAAQRYLSKFSKLIRMTLDNSKSVFIKLSDEIKLLELYLELEKMRFEEKFNYRIVVEEKITKERLLVPNMLVQPFIENSVKHGFKEGIRDAEIRVEFREEEGYIWCRITDNGIGRTRAGEIQGSTGSRHKSAGLSMISDKVEALSYYYQYEIKVEVKDLVNEWGQAGGTEVLIRMPKKTAEI